MTIRMVLVRVLLAVVIRKQHHEICHQVGQGVDAAVEPGTDAERTLAAAHQAVFAKPLEDLVTPAYLDARVTMLYDSIPTLVYGPTSRGVHGIDEAVEIESVRRITKTIALFMARWCGLARRA